jgi:hypothetical protein
VALIVSVRPALHATLVAGLLLFHSLLVHRLLRFLGSTATAASSAMPASAGTTRSRLRHSYATTDNVKNARMLIANRTVGNLQSLFFMVFSFLGMVNMGGMMVRYYDS